MISTSSFVGVGANSEAKLSLKSLNDIRGFDFLVSLAMWNRLLDDCDLLFEKVFSIKKF